MLLLKAFQVLSPTVCCLEIANFPNRQGPKPIFISRFSLLSFTFACKAAGFFQNTFLCYHLCSMQRGAFCIFYVLICVPQNLYVEALILNVTVFGIRAFKKVIRLNEEAVRVEPKFRRTGVLIRWGSDARDVDAQRAGPARAQ